ncbi:MAG: serine/threonine protein kinase [Mycobacteriaceae bacterium]|nr:serine/threonine protein kinase [Mycobacteriaceae bacterium]
MSARSTALRAAMCAALLGGLAILNAATALAEPDTGAPADSDALSAALSMGYTPADCTPQPLTSGTLAIFSCGQNSDTNGPVQATYTLFDNASTLSAAFNARMKNDVLTPCGDSGETPTVWRTGSSGVTAGQVACGTRQNAAEIIWTTTSKNIMSDIRGSNTDINALYQWWRING